MNLRYASGYVDKETFRLNHKFFLETKTNKITREIIKILIVFLNYNGESFGLLLHYSSFLINFVSEDCQLHDSELTFHESQWTCCLVF